MGNIILVRPDKSHEAAAKGYVEEHFAVGERDLHGASLLEKMDSYDAWLDHLDRGGSEDTVEPGWVPASTFFVVRPADGRVVGVLDIRHRLNDFLRSYGGHIGYGVRPSERRKGCANEILGLGLDYCREIGLDKVMLACYKRNEASRRTILRWGGVLEREFIHEDFETVQVYWIALP